MLLMIKLLPQPLLLFSLSRKRQPDVKTLRIRQKNMCAREI